MQLNPSARLDAMQSSQIVELSQIINNPMEPPTAIARDLFRINKKPCILLTQWGADAEQIVQEAENLSLCTRALQYAGSLLQFLESSGVPGDAVPSQAISEWYNVKYRELKKTPPADQLFDLSALIVGIIKDLAFTLDEVNRLNITQRSILVPLCLVRSWEISFNDRVLDDETLVKLITK
jgi:hypothetical protein